MIAVSGCRVISQLGVDIHRETGNAKFNTRRIRRRGLTIGTCGLGSEVPVRAVTDKDRRVCQGEPSGHHNRRISGHERVTISRRHDELGRETIIAHRGEREAAVCKALVKEHREDVCEGQFKIARPAINRPGHKSGVVEDKRINAVTESDILDAGKGQRPLHVVGVKPGHCARVNQINIHNCRKRAQIKRVFFIACGRAWLGGVNGVNFTRRGFGFRAVNPGHCTVEVHLISDRRCFDVIAQRFLTIAVRHGVAINRRTNDCRILCNELALAGVHGVIHQRETRVVIVTCGVADFVRQHRQQVDTNNIGTGQHVANHDIEFNAVIGCRIDEPAKAGGVDINLDQIASDARQSRTIKIGDCDAQIGKRIVIIQRCAPLRDRCLKHRFGLRLRYLCRVAICGHNKGRLKGVYIGLIGGGIICHPVVGPRDIVIRFLHLFNRCFGDSRRIDFLCNRGHFESRIITTRLFGKAQQLAG